jgi:hypothetical protein
MTWIVRRITCVRTSTAGLRAARVAVLLLGAGLKASAARPPAVTAMTTATTREYFVRMKERLRVVDRRDSVGWRVIGPPSHGKRLAKSTIFLAPPSDLFARAQQAAYR